MDNFISELDISPDGLMGLTFKSTLQDVFNLLVERDFRTYINDKPMDGPLDNPEWYINQDYIEFRR